MIGEGSECEKGRGMCGHSSHMSGSYTYAHVSAATCDVYTESEKQVDVNHS